MRLDALVELLGPTWGDVLGTGDYSRSALAVLERYADPRALKKLGRKRLATLLIRASRGAWRESKADDLLLAADESSRSSCGSPVDSITTNWPPTLPASPADPAPEQRDRGHGRPHRGAL